MLKKLMTVSRRFREGVVNNVSFWKCLDKEFCQDKGLKTRLSRSKNASLALGARFTGLPEMMNFLSKTLPLKDRLEHVQIDLLSNPLGVAWLDIAQLFPAIGFPSVISLRLWTINSPGYGKFFDEWKFPYLRKLGCTSYTPPPGIFSGLKELKLSFGGGSPTQSRFYIRKLIELLRSIGNLQSLSLDVRGLT